MGEGGHPLTKLSHTALHLAEEDGTDDLAMLRTYVAGVVEHYNRYGLPAWPTFKKAESQLGDLF